MSHVLTSHSPFKKRRHSQVSEPHDNGEEPARSHVKIQDTREASPIPDEDQQDDVDDQDDEDDASLSSSLFGEIMDTAELQPCYDLGMESRFYSAFL